MSDSQERRDTKAGDAELLQGFAARYDALRKEIHKVVIGQEKVVEELLISLFSRGLANSRAAGISRARSSFGPCGSSGSSTPQSH